MDLEKQYKDFGLEYASKKLIWKDVNIFINELEHRYECEAIINPEGEVAYATIGHVQSLIEFSGESTEDIYNKMPIWESPLPWMIFHTKCTCVWPYGSIAPENYTQNQKETLEELMKANLVGPERNIVVFSEPNQYIESHCTLKKESN